MMDEKTSPQQYRLYQFGVERYFDENRMLHSPVGGGPAVANTNNKQFEWYHHGFLHRDGGPALVNEVNGSKVWYKHGKLHRTDGPAIDEPGRKMWFRDGVLHREDGPAVVRKTVQGWSEEFYVNGVELSADEFARRLAPPAPTTTSVVKLEVPLDKPAETKKKRGGNRRKKKS